MVNFLNGTNTTANTTPMFNRNLPNGGGSYSIGGAGSTPIFSGVTAPVTAPVTTPAKPVVTPTQPPVDLYAKYRDPKTGNVMSPEEYAIYLGNKVPKTKGTGDVPQYAGDALTQTNPSVTDLTSTARNLNNARNDIATGATDPYKVGAQSGVAYSPAELAAIEKAYAGIYDPALNDVFTRLKEKQTQDAQKQKQADQIFATNESIRQWKETTGTGPTYSGAGGNQFTKTQLNTGASNAGMTIEDFTNLDDNMKNFFIQNPTELDPSTNKQVPVYSTFTNLIKGATTGQITVKDATDEIMNSKLPDSVKAHFIALLPLTDVEKKGFWSQIWGAFSSI
jgi:hypothetical protein